MQVLSKVLRDLRDGRYKTETDPYHVLLYKDNTITSPKEWSELLTYAYIWYDWFSQPQPSRGTSEDEIATLNRDLTLALDSVSAYVERADTLVILAPSHSRNIFSQTHHLFSPFYTFSHSHFLDDAPRITRKNISPNKQKKIFSQRYAGTLQSRSDR